MSAETGILVLFGFSGGIIGRFCGKGYGHKHRCVPGSEQSVPARSWTGVGIGAGREQEASWTVRFLLGFVAPSHMKRKRLAVRFGCPCRFYLVGSARAGALARTIFAQEKCQRDQDD